MCSRAMFPFLIVSKDKTEMQDGGSSLLLYRGCLQRRFWVGEVLLPTCSDSRYFKFTRDSLMKSFNA